MRTLCLLLLSCLGCFGQAFSFADPTVASWGGAPAAAAGSGPVTFDAVSPVAVWTNLVSPGPQNTNAITYSHTVGAGLANGYLLVATAIDDGASNNVLTATYNGVSMSRITNAFPNADPTAGNVLLYGLAAPAAGAHNVVVTLTSGIGTESSDKILSAAISFSHVSSISHTNKNTGSGTAVTCTIASTTDNTVVGWVAGGAAFSAWQAIDRAHTNSLLAHAASCVGLSSTNSTGNIALSWTMGDDWWAAVAVDLAHD